MKFEVKLEYSSMPPHGISNPVIIVVNKKSYLVMIYSDEMKLANTGYPQPEIDYNCDDGKRIPKIIGVDCI